MNFEELLYLVPAALIAIIFHEAAHGYVSYWLGDPTPKQEGRLSLNPKYHLDILGTLCLIFFHFGWAKPVRVNPNYYKNKKLGMALVALAGPFINFLIAFLALIVYGIIELWLFNPQTAWDEVSLFFYYLAVINIGLGIFNLFIIPPLDGSKILAVLLPNRIYYWLLRYERIFVIALVVLLGFGLLDKPLEYLFDGVYQAMVSLVSGILGFFE